MPSAIVRAAATGLSSVLFDRRRMLLGLAAASTAAATATAALEPSASENPELIRLAKELPALADQYHAAWKHQRDTEAKWAPLWPLASDDITEHGTGSIYGNPLERTFQGGARARLGEEHPRRLIPASTFRFHIHRAERALKSKRLQTLGTLDGRNRAEWEAELAEDKRCLALAEAYEAETKRISQESNYTASWQGHRDAAKALETHVSRIMAEPDQTMEGLIIKAEALEAWDSVEWWRRAMKPASADWHGKIAASILRMARSA